MRILVVDDEMLLVKGIRYNLEKEGYEVAAAYDGKTAVDMARRESFDLIILDLMMPGMPGTDACMEIRSFSDVPIIMLTARSESADKLMGFACGADDYVTKPFNILELLARIRVLLRRTAAPAAQEKAQGELLTAGGLTLDTRQRVAIREGKSIDLTAKEYDRTVDVHIRRLREKLERKPAEPELIMTKWGVGYYFNGESQSAV